MPYRWVKLYSKHFPAIMNCCRSRSTNSARNFCLYMDTFGEHFAEFGLDIAIDTDKRLWLIEANVFPSFKGFKKMDLETYLSIRYTPLLYAASLTQFGECLNQLPIPFQEK